MREVMGEVIVTCVTVAKEGGVGVRVSILD